MSHDPASTEPEYLGDAPADTPPGRRRPRGALIAVAAVGAAGAVAAGSWAAVSFMSGGSQPTTVIPATALAYAGFDLDPSAAQKIEAMRIIKKFPALDKELGMDAQDDIRKAILDEALADCKGVSYDDDVAPWIGERAAVAAVPGDKKGADPQPVVALQVSDEQLASEKLTELFECGEAEAGAFVVAAGYAVIAETEKAAQATVDAAAEASLADDSTFQRWTGEVGDPGIVTVYAAPGAPAALVGLDEAMAGPGMGMTGAMDPKQVEELTKSFEGAAGVVRFEDGAVEAEFAAGGLPEAYVGGEDAVTSVGDLPDSTGMVYAMAFTEGWLQDYVEMMSSAEGMSAEELWAEAEAATGLELPEDAETLLGDSVSIVVDSSLDAKVFQEEDPSNVPAGIRITGDADEITRVVDKLKRMLGPDAEMLVTETGDGTVALGLSQEYVGKLVDEGTLGEDPAFQAVVPDADRAAGVWYLNFDAGDGWVEALAGDAAAMFEAPADGHVPDDSGDIDAKIKENIAPLDAMGVSSWLDGNTARGLLRLTTDD